MEVILEAYGPVLAYNRAPSSIELSRIGVASLLNSSDIPSEQPSHSTAPNKADPQRSRWTLNKTALDKLLSCFSSDREEAGAQYEVTRRKLIRFFEWRAVELPEDHADETINRVARRIEEGQKVENVQSYVYGVARMVFKEAVKERERAPLSLDNVPQGLNVPAPGPVDEPDRRLLCFDRCFESLPADHRQLILDYYQEERRAKIELRQQMADRLHIQVNALRIRAHRIRMTLETCIMSCLEADSK